MSEQSHLQDLGEHFLEVVLKHGPDLVYYKDSDHRFREVGQAYADIFGSDPEDLLGKTARDLWPDDVAAGILADERQVLEGDAIIDRERSVDHPDGSTHWYSIHKIPHRNEGGDVAGFFGMDREITERKRQARETRRFKRAVEAAGHAVYITDPDAIIRYVNPAFEEITGFAAETAVGNTPRLMKSGEMSEEYYEKLWSTILDGNVWDREIINRRNNGEKYTAHQTIAPITNGTKEIQAFVAIQSDISARKNLEERLSVLNRVLRHDIRSAVSILRGNAELALDAEDDPDPFIETIQSETDRLYDLTEKARTLQQLISDDRTAVETVDLSTLLTVKAQKYSDMHPDLTVRTTVPDGVTVEASVHMDEAIDELLTNAIQHNESPQKRIDISLDTDISETDWVDVAIADNGPGIPEDERGPIMEGQETQIHHTSGMGLWLVNWIVKASGGELELTRRDGRGTEVHVRVPRWT